MPRGGSIHRLPSAFAEATAGRSTIQVKGIHHTAVIVTDMDRARRFYGGVLGLEEIPRPHFAFDGAWYRVGDRQELHLIVYPDARAVRGTTDIDGRDGHFALRVASYAATVEHLRAQGVPCRELPDNPTPWAQIYVTDPDGNVLELHAERSTI